MSIKLSFVITSCITIICAASVIAATSGLTKLYYYSAENCPHCLEYGPLVHRLADSFQNIELISDRSFETWLDEFKAVTHEWVHLSRHYSVTFVFVYQSFFGIAERFRALEMLVWLQEVVVLNLVNNCKPRHLS